MKRRGVSLVLAAWLLAGCATVPQIPYLASKKSALELRAMQSRTVEMPADAAMRAVIATLHDLGYRITRVAADAGSVSATREATLRMAVVVQPRSPTESVVRANASLVSVREEAQVDSPEFYRRNFFEPLASTSGRVLALLGENDPAPEAARPTAEINTERERKALAAASAPPQTKP